MDPNQTAPVGAVFSGSTLFAKEALNISAFDSSKLKPLYVICALRFNEYEFSVYTAMMFIKCTHTL